MADKTLGDYAVEAEKAMANNSTADLPPIIAEMRAAAPPPPETPAEPPPPPPATDLGLTGFADALEATVASNDVATARDVCDDMKEVAPPTEPTQPQGQGQQQQSF